jgi:hypothetical protein
MDKPRIRRHVSRSKKPPTPEPQARKPDPVETEDDLRELFSDVENPKQLELLVAYVETKSLLKAQELSGVHRQSHYWWMENDPKYAKYFRRAKTIIADDIEGEAYRRAFVGIEVPIYYYGRLVGTYKEYDDKLAMFMLKRMRPEIYDSAGGMDPSYDPSRIWITKQMEGPDGKERKYELTAEGWREIGAAEEPQAPNGGA